MTRRPTIGIVHQERSIIVALGLAFESAGFSARRYFDSGSALDRLSQWPADIAIIGRTLRPICGPELFRRLRLVSEMPVIFLSSRGEALQAEAPGADDYVATPFSLRLLVERTRTVLRRRELNGLHIESGRCRCFWRGRRIYLTMPEFLMLEALGDRGVWTRLALMEAAYGPDLDMEADVVDDHIGGLRRKLRAAGAADHAVEMVGGVAYRLSRQL
jgi:two-component system response regulator ChvI